MARVNTYGELYEGAERTACGRALRKLRSAGNRGRMSSETAQAIDRHFTSCETCNDAHGYSFRKRFASALGIAPKVRPWKPLRVAGPVPPSLEPIAPPPASFDPTSDSEPPSLPPAEKPKRIRKPAGTGTTKPRRSRSKTARAAAATE